MTRQLTSALFLSFLSTICFLGSALAQSDPGRTSAPQATYRVGGGDVLHISAGPGAARTEAFHRTEQIGPDGFISFDLIGSVRVDAMTTDEIDALLTNRLSEFIRDVEVTVIIAQFAARRVFVLGEVGKPGPYVISKQMTLLDAIAEAGSPTEDANPKKVKLIKNGSTEANQEIIRVNLKKLSKDGHLDQNLMLADGDVIYVPTGGLSKWGRRIDKIFKPLQPIFYIGFLTGVIRFAN